MWYLFDVIKSNLTHYSIPIPRCCKAFFTLLSLSLRFLLHQLLFFQGKFKSQIQSHRSNRSFFYFLRSVQILLFFHRSVNFLLFIDFFIWSCNFILCDPINSENRSCMLLSLIFFSFSVRSGWISWYRCTLLMY